MYQPHHRSLCRSLRDTQAIAGGAAAAEEGAPARGSSYKFAKKFQHNFPIRFFTGNGAVDAGAAGLAAGLATSYFTNQIFNPCRRGGTRTNNRLGGNTGNFLLGAAVGWAGGTLINNALCNGR